jgi:hypothetical protein
MSLINQNPLSGPRCSFKPPAGRSPPWRSVRRTWKVRPPPRGPRSALSAAPQSPLRLEVPRDTPSTAAPCLLEDLASSLPPSCLEAPSCALSASTAPPRPCVAPSASAPRSHRARFLRPSSVEEMKMGRFPNSQYAHSNMNWHLPIIEFHLAIPSTSKQ